MKELAVEALEKPICSNDIEETKADQENSYFIRQASFHGRAYTYCDYIHFRKYSAIATG